MQYEVIRTQHQSALHLSAKRHNRFGMKVRISARQVHQVVGMNRQRPQIVSFSKGDHLRDECGCKFVGLPLPRTGGENLQGIAAEAISTLSSVVNTPCRRSVDPDATGATLGRLSRSGQQLQDVVFFEPQTLGHAVRLYRALLAPKLLATLTG